MSRIFTIRVPSTSANIGPGFDVVGLSLSLHLTLTVTVPVPRKDVPYQPPTITYSGEGADEVPLDAYTTRVAPYGGYTSYNAQQTHSASHTHTPANTLELWNTQRSATMHSG